MFRIPCKCNVFLFVFSEAKVLNKIYFIKLYLVMETQEHTTLIHMQQIPPVEARQQTWVLQRRAVHVSAARVLG